MKKPDLDNVMKVALHPEGVDRNNNAEVTTVMDFASPSTRRAWIEIIIG